MPTMASGFSKEGRFEAQARQQHTLGGPPPASLPKAPKWRDVTPPEEWRHVSHFLRLIETGIDFGELVRPLVKAATLSSSDVGWFLRESGRVPFPLPPSGYAYPRTPDTPYPPSVLFPFLFLRLRSCHRRKGVARVHSVE